MHKQNILVLTGSQYKETAKARYLNCFISIFESSIVSFLIPFINETIVELNFDSLNLSTILGLLPLFSLVCIGFFSFFTTKHKNIILLMKIIVAINFVLLMSLGFFILYYKVNSEETKDVFFIVITIFCSLITGLHVSLNALQTTSIAYINQYEKTTYGYACLYGPLVSIIVSPLAGYVANSLFVDYRGYGFLFLVFSPFSILSFITLFLLKPCINYLDYMSNKSFRVRDIFKNKTYLNYFLIVIILVPFDSLTSSLSSTMWNFERIDALNLFNSLNWGIVLGCQALIETIVIYINVIMKVCRKIATKTKIATASLSVSLIILSIAASCMLNNGYQSVFVLIIISMLIRGINTGIYWISNISNINTMMNYRYRTKAVLLQNASYQFVNCLFSFIYPLLIVNKNVLDDSLLFLIFAIFSFVISINYTNDKDYELFKA